MAYIAFLYIEFYIESTVFTFGDGWLLGLPHDGIALALSLYIHGNAASVTYYLRHPQLLTWLCHASLRMLELKFVFMLIPALEVVAFDIRSPLVFACQQLSETRYDIYIYTYIYNFWPEACQVLQVNWEVQQTCLVKSYSEDVALLPHELGPGFACYHRRSRRRI